MLAYTLEYNALFVWSYLRFCHCTWCRTSKRMMLSKLARGTHLDCSQLLELEVMEDQNHLYMLSLVF